jgi:hypothetical protein
MKKLLTALFVAITLIAVAAPSKPAIAQAYCNHCCDTDPWGNARIRCTLNASGLCGYECYCNGIPGAGFACY